MSKKQFKGTAVVDRAFIVMEATSYAGGGFPAYMNMLMESMIEQMQMAGISGPYKWTWSGGDGVTVPVHLTCSVEA